MRCTIKGRLYDLSSFRHPGGDAVFEILRSRQTDPDLTNMLYLYHRDPESILSQILPKYEVYAVSITYTDSTDFTNYMRLKRRVHEAIRERSLSTGWSSMEWAIHGIILGVYLIMWCLYLSRPTWWSAIGLALIVSWWGSNIVHEVSHRVGWTGRRANLMRILENIACPFLDADQWFYDHAYLHHSYTNTGKDPDVSSVDWVRFLPNGRWRAYHQYQSAYLPLLATMTTFVKGVWPSVIHEINLASMMSFLVVLWCSRNDMMKFLVLFMLPGPLFIMPAMLNHVQHECTLGEEHTDFLRHQLSTTINYRTNWFTRLLSFNLDIQIEHHLFPNIAHSTLRRVQDVVQGFCKEYNLPYLEKPSMWAAYRDFQSIFRQLGKKTI